MTALMWAVLIAAAILITIWAIIRKGLAGIPLIFGVWLLLLSGYLTVVWFPPTPGKLALISLLYGLSIGLIVWGLVNVLVQIMGEIRETVKGISSGCEYEIVVWKPAKVHYGVLYGRVPWDSEGAEYFHRFVNENVWKKGLKITQLNIELEVYGGIRIAWVWGLLEPKTIIDRILY